MLQPTNAAGLYNIDASVCTCAIYTNIYILYIGLGQSHALRV